MTREEIRNLAISTIDTTKCLILELSTGVGKTKISIDLVNHLCDRVWKTYQEPTSVLIIVAKVVHKQTWLDEIKKWGGVNTDDITIECYESLHKYQNKIFDVVILDEAHHLSDAKKDILKSIKIGEALIGLSATLKKDLKEYLKYSYNAKFISCGIKEAINSNILPNPKVYLIPMELDDTLNNYKSKKYGKEVITTQKGYYDNLSSLIEWFKEKYFRTNNSNTKNLWLSLAGKRLKWLSEQKEGYVFRILQYLKDSRTLTFCSSIEQTEKLGLYNITSKNKNSTYYLNKFNNGRINHITACSILNEGVNLYNCRVGIFCSINSSEIIVKQRLGRILRHKSPIVIIPFFKDTREEELVNKMLESYNKESIKIINDYKKIKL